LYKTDRGCRLQNFNYSKFDLLTLEKVLYSFESLCRVVSYIPNSSNSNSPLCSLPSPPSPPLTIPLTDLTQAVTVLARGRAVPEFPDPVWLRDFELQYIELEEVRLKKRSEPEWFVLIFFKPKTVFLILGSNLVFSILAMVSCSSHARSVCHLKKKKKN
jgi:hypothetical protein